jgi:hypothetical protein
MEHGRRSQNTTQRAVRFLYELQQSRGSSLSPPLSRTLPLRVHRQLLAPLPLFSSGLVGWRRRGSVEAGLYRVVVVDCLELWFEMRPSVAPCRWRSLVARMRAYLFAGFIVRPRFTGGARWLVVVLLLEGEAGGKHRCRFTLHEE